MKKQRICLKCQRVFDSSHIGNRICPECHARNSHIIQKHIDVKFASNYYDPNGRVVRKNIVLEP